MTSPFIFERVTRIDLTDNPIGVGPALKLRVVGDDMPAQEIVIPLSDQNVAAIIEAAEKVAGGTEQARGHNQARTVRRPSVKPFTTADAAWTSYREQVVSKEASDAQVLETQRAFYAALCFVMGLLNAIREGELSEDEGRAALSAIDLEVADFVDLQVPARKEARNRRARYKH